MVNYATPNLPSRDYDATEAFYCSIGFTTSWRDAGWMIMQSNGLQLEFFRYPDLDPAESSFGCCLRLDDLHAFYTSCIAAKIPAAKTGWPRLHPATKEHSGLEIAYLVDPDGSLIRLVQNPK